MLHLGDGIFAVEGLLDLLYFLLAGWVVVGYLPSASEDVERDESVEHMLDDVFCIRWVVLQQSIRHLPHFLS